MNPDLDKLNAYPFARLRDLLADVTPPPGSREIAMSIGEPQHQSPDFCSRVLQENSASLGRYPATAGGEPLREALAGWLMRRFGLRHIDPASEVLSANGSREALFAFAQCVVDPAPRPLVMMPNPFYQIYEGAALLAGAQPYFLNCTADNGFLPDFSAVPKSAWERCQLIYICTPGNPSGAVLPGEHLQELISLADRYDFVIASDECYSEIYYSAPPVGLLEVCARLGRDDYKRCVVFNSLSKRSNLPGLRSGLIAGDQALIDAFRLYRTYHGGAMPGPAQALSVAVWSDEEHVIANRALYQAKLTAVMKVVAGALPVMQPEAGFFLWPEIGDDDAQFARALFGRHNVVALPGKFLARYAAGVNPGRGRLRLALVADEADCCEAMRRLVTFYTERL